MTERERELLEETEFTRPVDFHSWRRHFVQALADMGMNAQQAQKLAGHADLSAHERYLRSSARTLEIPTEALPDLSSRVLPHRWAKPSGSVNESGLISARPAGLEPATSGLETHCSIQLSYGRKCRKGGLKAPWFPGFVKASGTFGRTCVGRHRAFRAVATAVAMPLSRRRRPGAKPLSRCRRVAAGPFAIRPVPASLSVATRRVARLQRLRSGS
jgi:hypothetical protein